MRIIDKLNPIEFLEISETEEITTDYLIVGTGIAGLRAAIEVAKKQKVFIITKSALIETNTNYAQGGIAVVLSHEDEFNLHIEDTLYAGAGLCDYTPVETLVKEGPVRIHELIAMNTNFDKRADGELSMTKEAAHSRSRILHAGDTTGAEIERALTETIKKNKNVSIGEYIFIISIIDKNTSLAYDLRKNKYIKIYYKGLIMATGSIGQIYENTSNPDVATGDGIALAYRYGAEIADMEFVQFHPTTFHKKDAPCFLISESLRGEGGILRNSKNERFMENYHSKKELAPRDVVSRSILHEMQRLGDECVFLDMTVLDKEYLFARFPNISKFCLDYGIDISKDYIPVSPAAHYMMGGIKVDINGKTNMEYFYAAGEVAMSGVHGANRLASNSLLEGLVFGKRAGEKALKETVDVDIIKISNVVSAPIREKITSENIIELKNRLKKIMWNNVGIIRDQKRLDGAINEIKLIAETISKYKFDTVDIQTGVELLNMLTVSYLICEMASDRKESRGAHYRTDFPEKKDKYKIHFTIQKRSE